MDGRRWISPAIPGILAPVPREYRHVHRDKDCGWQVQLRRRGRLHKAWFGDRGDPRAALQRALAWRDKMIEALPPARKFKLSYSRNTTGVVGVHLSRDRSRRSRRRFSLRYAATWNDEHGRTRKRSFSVAKYGPRKARALAIQARREALKKLLRPPCADDVNPQLAIKRTLAWQRRMIEALPPPLRLHRKNAGNTSGVIGVQLTRKRGVRKTLLRWAAFSYDGHGRKRARHFSTEKYGYKRARSLAIQARREMIQAFRAARA